MKRKFIPTSMSSAQYRKALFLLALGCAGSTVYAEKQDIIVDPCNNVNTTYAATPGQAIPAGVDIEVSNPGNVTFDFSPGAGCNSTGGNTYSCAGMTVTHPALGVSVPNSSKITITGTAGALGAVGIFAVTVTDAATPAKTCTGNYVLHVTSNGGGWGDPHMSTVDGVAYDFQSAGEFTALRQDGFEVQTRQTPVPSATVPGANQHTGLAVCVSVYTAVAAKIGSNRVTYQPNLIQPGLLGAADPSGMQLRVNGELVTLPDGGIDLTASGGAGTEGRVLPAAGGGIEIVDRRGTQIVATPKFWSGQQKWYLNLNVYQTSAIQGIWGRVADRWLPALPNGSTLGQRPDSAPQRYQQLYETFADAWRVTDATSLFDYAAGTNTATFTLDEWPRLNPQSCEIQGQTPVQPATPQVAETACAGVTNDVQKANCVFDVTVTGETGFAQSYEAMQTFRPHGTGFQPVLAGVTTPPLPHPPAGWPWSCWILILILGLILILMLLRKKAA